MTLLCRRIFVFGRRHGLTPLAEAAWCRTVARLKLNRVVAARVPRAHLHTCRLQTKGPDRGGRCAALLGFECWGAERRGSRYGRPRSWRVLGDAA
jgi:hypothetical protein